MCNLIKKLFIQAGGLKKHILIHTGENPHECNLCKKQFANLSHLMHHMLSHR